jgi:hypothetical protein
MKSQEYIANELEIFGKKFPCMRAINPYAPFAIFIFAKLLQRIF